MKKFTKITALLLSLLMLCSFFAGCGDSNEYADIEIASPEELDPAVIGDYSTLKLPLDTKGTTITAFVSTDVTTNNDSVFVKELRRRTGINLQIIAVPVSAAKEKAKILIASQDDMPDMMGSTGFQTNEVNDLGNQGAFAEILQYQDKLPNFKKIYVDEAEERGVAGNLKNIMSPEGNLYFFPVYDINRDVNHGMLYRKDIFDKHGIEMWHDKDSFLDVLRQLKKLYPNSVPYASKTGSTIFRDIGYSWGLQGFAPYYDEETGLWKYSCADPKFKELIDFLKTMYKEGLVDPEFLTCTQAAWTQKMTQRDKAFVTWDWIGRLDMFKQQTASTVPEYDLRYAYPIGGKVVTLARTGGGPVIKKGKNELLTLQLNDYLLSDSGAQLTTMGVEGVTYTLREDGKADYIGFEGQKGVGINPLESEYGLYISGIYRRFDRRCSYYDFTEREQEAQDMMLNKEGGGFMPLDPVLAFNEEEKEIKAKYETAIGKAAEEFAVKYVLSDTSGDKDWNEWLEKLKKLGGDEVIKQYNTAQERYNKL